MVTPCKLVLSVFSPWQWFCSTRTLSNCLETALTIAALNYWPWHVSLEESVTDSVDMYGMRITHEEEDDDDDDDDDPLSKSVVQWVILGRQLSPRERDRIRVCLVLAALACVLRPTNVLIWMCLAGFAISKATRTEAIVLVREIVLCGYDISIYLRDVELTRLQRPRIGSLSPL
jgi:GPI mannosyltransferase 3